MPQKSCHPTSIARAGSARTARSATLSASATSSGDAEGARPAKGNRRARRAGRSSSATRRSSCCGVASLQATRVGLSGSYDLIAMVPNDSECRSVAESGAATLVYRSTGKNPFVLSRYPVLVFAQP